jgi:hypothetical protein
MHQEHIEGAFDYVARSARDCGLKSTRLHNVINRVFGRD